MAVRAPAPTFHASATPRDFEKAIGQRRLAVIDMAMMEKLRM
jgi:hypothetical protein